MSDLHDWYGRLIRLYPAAIRERYGRQMLQVFDDLLAATPRGWARRHLVLRLAGSELVHLVGAHLDDGAIRTPSRVRRCGAVSAGLLVPFVLATGLDAAGSGGLERTWAWSSPALSIWLVVLPAVAATTAGCAWLTSAAAGTGPMMLRLVDVPRLWMVMVPAALALGILGFFVLHDSTHCVIDQPMPQMWGCIRAGLIGG